MRAFVAVNEKRDLEVEDFPGGFSLKLILTIFAFG